MLVKTWRPHYPQCNLTTNIQRFRCVMPIATNAASSRYRVDRDVFYLQTHFFSPENVQHQPKKLRRNDLQFQKYKNPNLPKHLKMKKHGMKINQLGNTFAAFRKQKQNVTNTKCFTQGTAFTFFHQRQNYHNVWLHVTSQEGT